ncbi:MAE_28990/MAE_18760 family HEPN-like nuclease [Pseudomonas marginalis]|uniref:MAE_28990/MAE_18760 family HEPN-like nuclease n=1 Tax=Pseudomonas marginalis TaxID=298 RepID=UPI00248032E2|nr:HEPN domain-containing protein [Pseudomonas marginalis]WGT30138.1 HEPN domain-containing protein [Pseudomonas marginalis]
MSTFLQEYVASLEERWEEVDLIISKAKSVKDDDFAFYNAICRSATILIVAHLEGFVKDLTKCIVSDLNRNASFINFPIAVKRTYCSKYLGITPEKDIGAYQKKMDALIFKLDEFDCKISHEPFLFQKNKNPSVNMLTTVFENFGLSNVFGYLHDSSTDDAFAMSLSEIKEKNAALKASLINSTAAYPYTTSFEELGFEKRKPKGRTLWEEFIEQINQRRHSVAHGSDFNNADDISDLEKRKAKVELLQYSLSILLAGALCKPST